MNMAAVTASTKSESPRIEWAGVDTGAKIFVGLIERSADRESGYRQIKENNELHCKPHFPIGGPLFCISIAFSQFTGTIQSLLTLEC